jgi:uncharacterized protein (DUF1697 family)
MRYVALLRGINVGGNTMIKMENLRAMFEGLGFENVVSYINSGNLAFDVSVGSPHVSKGSSKKLESELSTKIEKAVESHLGKPVQVMVRKQKHIENVLEKNPFDGQFASHKEMHVLFLKDKLSAESEKWLNETSPPGERFKAVGREIYCHLPMGVADSYLGRGQFEKKLKISVTARNWRTVQKLAEL